MKLLEQFQRDGTVNPQLEYCIYLPDAVHVGKSCKCSFSNLFCILEFSRLSLSVLHNLRDDSNLEIRSKLRTILTKEDVQNKDRMAFDPILRLCSTKMLDVLSAIDTAVVHTLIPEKYKFVESNRIGFYPHPMSVCIGPTGKFKFSGLQPFKQRDKVMLSRFPQSCSCQCY